MSLEPGQTIEHLDGMSTTKDDVLCSVNHRHAAFSKLSLDTVVADGLSGLKRHRGAPRFCAAEHTTIMW